VESTATSPPAAQRQAFHDLLRQRDFGLLLAGQLLSQVGDQCTFIAAVILITGLSASPLAVFVPAVAIALPQVLFGLVGGVIADRWNRKWVMIGSDLVRGLVVLAILLVRNSGQLWILYLAAAALAVVGTFFYPARNATIPNIVPDGLLLAANGLIQGSYIIALTLGPTLAGVIVDLWGLESAIIFDSGTFLLSAATILFIRIPPLRNCSPAQGRQASMWQDMKAGLDFMRRSRLLRRVLYVTAAATLGLGAVIVLAIPHLRTRLEAGGIEYGAAMSMLGIGSVLGGALVTRLSRRFSTSTIVGAMLVAAGAAIVAFAYASTFLIVLASVTVLGMCIIIARGALCTITQSLSPDEVRGRVQAAVNLIMQAGTALAQGLSALLGHFVGVQTIFVGAGVVTTAVGLMAAYGLREVASAAHPADEA
jgi:DHA3 family macrolide efflux protein-like MFS transporter